MSRMSFIWQTFVRLLKLVILVSSPMKCSETDSLKDVARTSFVISS